MDIALGLFLALYKPGMVIQALNSSTKEIHRDKVILN